MMAIDKAAQAAAQAAQTAALQSHIPATVNPYTIHHEQLQHLQRQMKLQMAQSPTQRQFPHIADTEQYDLLPRKAFSPFSAESGNIFAQRDALYHNEMDMRGHEEAIKVHPPGSRSVRYGAYLGEGSPPANRGPGRLDQHSRPSSRHIDGQEFDAMHDLNGTLASLDLDRDRSWKSPTESSDSSASVQFQMGRNSTSSP